MLNTVLAPEQVLALYNDGLSQHVSIGQNLSFENTYVGGYENNPSNASWVFTNSAGIARPGSIYLSATPPDGNLAAYIQNKFGFYQTMTFPAGIYSVSTFCGRLSKENNFISDYKPRLE